MIVYELRSIISRNQWMKLESRSQFEPLCGNHILLYVSCTILVKSKLSEIYFVTNCFSWFSHTSRYCCLRAPPFVANYWLLIHPIPTHSVPPQLWLIPSFHIMSPLNDGGSHGSSLYPPSMIVAPMAPHYFPSIIMAPVSPSNISSLNYDGSLMMNRIYQGNCLCTKRQLAWLEDYFRVHIYHDNGEEELEKIQDKMIYPKHFSILIPPLI